MEMMSGMMTIASLKTAPAMLATTSSEIASVKAAKGVVGDGVLDVSDGIVGNGVGDVGDGVVDGGVNDCVGNNGGGSG